MSFFRDSNQAFRTRWIRRCLGALPHGWKILDAGAGEQPFRKDCAHLHYVSQDFSLYTGMGNGRGLQTGTWNALNVDIVCDISTIPRPDSSFDAILCSEVFEHIPDPLMALREFARLLRPGGRLILTAPFYSLTHFAPYHFCTGFNRYFFEHHLPRFGFRIMEIIPNGDLFSCLTQDFLRVPFLLKPKWLKAAVLVPALGAVVLLRIIRAWMPNTADLMCFGFHLTAELSQKNP